MNKYNKLLKQAQAMLADSQKISEKNAKKRKINWVSDIESKLVLYNEQSTNIDGLVDIPVTINKARLAHYPTKKELEDDMATVYGSFFLNDNDLGGTTKSQWLTAKEVMQQLYENSKLGNHVFLPSAIEVHRYGKMTPYGFWSNRTEYQQFVTAANNANRSNDMVFYESEMIAVDVDTHTTKPIDFIDSLPPILKSILIGIIPTPSYGYTDEEGVTTYGCRLLFSSPSPFDMANIWGYTANSNSKISLMDYVEKKMHLLNKTDLEHKGIFVELEEREGDDYFNEIQNKKAGRIHYRKLILDVYKRMYDAIVTYIATQTDIIVDNDNVPDPQQQVRCGRGDYIVNCGVQCMTVHQMVNLDNNARAIRVEQEVETAIQLIDNKSDVVLEVYDSVPSPLEDDEDKDERKAILHKDWILKWSQQVGFIDNTTMWRKSLLAIASLCALGRIDSQDARLAAYAITYKKDYKAYDKWAINKVGDEPKSQNFPGQKFLMEIYEKNGGNKYELYEIPPAEKVEREERDRKQSKLYHEMFGANYSLLTIEDKLDIGTINEYILTGKGRTLLHSPTGSGKTHGIFNAIADYYKSGKGSGITIIAMPNITNITQTSVKFGDLLDKMFFGSASQGTYKNKIGSYDRAVRDAFRNGTRVFCVTYDSVQRVYDGILELDSLIKLDFLVVDEAHQAVTSYSYRNIAIDNLYNVIEKAELCIGMSGTIVDVNLDDYDKLVDVTLSRGNAIPAEDFLVLEHSNDKKIIDEIIRTIRGYIDSGTKQVLIFVENKKKQQRLAKTLTKLKYSTVVVNADNKEDDEVVELMADEYIDKDVIITTSVMSDGISLENTFDSVCIVVSSFDSQIWSPTVIRQMSNRFRNPYSALVWMRPRIAEKERNRRNGRVVTTQSYYSVIKQNSESLLVELKALESLENNKEGIPTVYLDAMEKEHRIRYDEYNTLYIDYKGLYYDAYVAKGESYAYNLTTLQDDIAYMLGLDVTAVYNKVESWESDVICREEIDKEIKKEQALIKQDYLDNIRNIITREVYYEFLAGGEHYGALDMSYKRVRDFLDTIPDGIRPSILANRFLPYADFMQFCTSHLGSNRKMKWYADTLEVYVDWIAYSELEYDNKTKVIFEYIDQTIIKLKEEYGVDVSQPKAGVVDKGEYFLKGIVDAIPNEAFNNIDIIEGYKVNKEDIKRTFEKYYKHRIVGAIRIYEKEKRNIYGQTISGNESEAIKQVNVCEIHHTYDIDYVMDRLGLDMSEKERLDKMAYYYARVHRMDAPQLVKHLERPHYGAGFKLPNVARRDFKHT